jgi:hypothetical protein
MTLAGFGQDSDSLSKPLPPRLNFGAWSPAEHASWLVETHFRMGFLSYLLPDGLSQDYVLTVDALPYVGYFVSPNWALGLAAELYGLSTGTDTLFPETGDGHSLGVFVRHYWWQRGHRLYKKRTYTFNFFVEGSLGLTSLAYIEPSVIETGGRLRHPLCRLSAGFSWQCLPRVYINYLNGCVGSVYEQNLLVLFDPHRMGISLVW